MDFISVTLKLLEGFGKTCEIFAITLVSALPLGLLVALGAMSRFRVLKYVLKTVIWVIRGTPLMLQVIVAYYGPALLFGWGVPPRMMAVLVAFVINYSCYFAEIYRGGIESVSKGQTEAGLVLGMTKSQIFFRVILLQVVKRIVPPMSNEFMTLIKDTSLARVIAVVDIIMVAGRFSARGVIWPLFYTALFFLVFCGLMTVIFGRIEKRLDYFKA